MINSMKKTLLLLERIPASSFFAILRTRIVSEIVDLHLVDTISSAIQFQLYIQFSVSPNQGCGEGRVLFSY